MLAELSRALDGDELLRDLARLLVRDLADYCVTYRLAEGRVRRVGAAHADPARDALVRRLVELAPPTLEDPVGVGAVVRTGTPILAQEISRPVLRRGAAGAEHLRVLRALRPVSSLVLPLQARGHTVGAVALATTSHSGRRYGEADLARLRELVDWAALAFDNVRLYDEARAEIARREAAEASLRRRYEQQRVLYQMTEAVARAGGLDEIYGCALDGLTRALEVERAAILLFDPDGAMRFKAWRGLSDGYRVAVEGHTPWTADHRDPAPIVVPDVDLDAGLGEPLRSTILTEGIRSMAFIPVGFGGRLLGKFMLYGDRPRALAPEELELTRSVAGTVAFAITRVRDQQSILAAKEGAERANEAKSQFLGIMSHELRTPLNAVLGYADLLLLETQGPLTPGQRHHLDRIQTSARHQLGLVDEVLTYARLEAGREEPRLLETDARRVVWEVAELIRPEVEAKGLRLSAEVPEAPVLRVTDPARLRQIVLNLAGNAVKYTERGEVTLRLVREGDAVLLRVLDTGPGIPADRLEYIFEPFTRVDETHTRETAGTGLGLAISRRLAALLGASVEVVSRPGEGSAFTVRLPGGAAGEG